MHLKFVSKTVFSFLSSSLDKLVKLSKYEDGQKKQHWQNDFKFSKRYPYVKTGEDFDLDLLTKGYIPMTTSLHLINSGKNNFSQKNDSTATSPKVIAKMMSMKGHKGYGNI